MSDAGDSQSIGDHKLSAPKNKQCPFCHESFTSSSLGRHLDLYVKEKNPKAPDGLHDVNKIRQIRSAITRRQPRRSTKHFDAEVGTPVNTVGHTGELVQQNRVSSAVGSPYKATHDADAVAPPWRFNQASWEATGVITDFSPTPGLPPDKAARQHASRAEIASQQRLIDQRTRARATELALQELLDSVNAASAQAHSPKPFDFDFESQTFPALCLKLLPRQPSLTSLQPVENPRYCPISPPSRSHLEHVARTVKSTVENFVAKQRQDDRRASTRSSASLSSTVAPHSPSFYLEHLMQAWDIWEKTPDSQRSAIWHLEVFRALGDAQDRQKDLSEALAKAQAEQEHLRIQVTRLNECQQPKEFIFQAPTDWQIDGDVAAAAASQNKGPLPNKESLIAKWTSVVRSHSKIQRATVDYSQDVTPANPSGMGVEKSEDDADGDEHDGSEDAAGEDDDDEGQEQESAALNQDRAVNETGNMRMMGTGFQDHNMLDPNLRVTDISAMDLDDPNPGNTGFRLTMNPAEARTRYSRRLNGI